MSPLALTSLIAALAAAVAFAVQPAVAAPTLPPVPDWVPAVASGEEEEAAEVESEVEDWDEVEEDAEVESEVEGWDEEEAEEEEEAEPRPGDTCPLRSASAHAVTKRERLKLTIGYTTNEPFDARITILRGTVQIGSVRRHLGPSGVLRFSEKLDEHGGKKIVTTIAASDRSAGCPSRRLVLFPR